MKFYSPYPWIKPAPTISENEMVSLMVADCNQRNFSPFQTMLAMTIFSEIINTGKELNLDLCKASHSPFRRSGNNNLYYTKFIEGKNTLVAPFASETWVIKITPNYPSGAGLTSYWQNNPKLNKNFCFGPDHTDSKIRRKVNGMLISVYDQNLRYFASALKETGYTRTSSKNVKFA